MDTNPPKTPATLPFAAWAALTPGAAAAEVHRRVVALPAPLRTAALAWLKPERELAADLERWNGLPSSRSERVEGNALHRIPYFLKDLFELAGVPTRAGSTFLDQVRPTPARDAAIVRRLQELGAGCAGKTHLVEFAAGLFGDNAHYGDCPHPRFSDRLAGGSSSGSASLVAAGVVPLAIGTDTGGSVRVPAAFCGVYGFRLSPRDDFISDAMPLSPTLDTAGWFTANATDMLTAVRALVGSISPDNTPSGCFLPATKFGIPFDPITAAAVDGAAAAIAPAADRDTTTALLSAWTHAIEAYTTIALHDANAVHRDWLAPYHEHYEPGIWQRFMAGGKYTPEQLARAAETMANVRESFRQYFQAHDYLVIPATPFPAPLKSECTPEARHGLLTLTTPASLAGLPTLTLPVSLPSGLSSGLQVILPAANSPVVPWLLNRQ